MDRAGRAGGSVVALLGARVDGGAHRRALHRRPVGDRGRAGVALLAARRRLVRRRRREHRRQRHDRRAAR